MKSIFRFLAGLWHGTISMFAIGTLQFGAIGDRLIVQEDAFKTGYECTTCGGSGKKDCSNCSGTGQVSHGGPVMRCGECEGNKVVTCPACNGKGGLLVAPETAERRPTTGTIMSAGPMCKWLKKGDQILYSNFAGYVMDLKRMSGEEVTMRLLHEAEVLALMKGHLTLSNLKGKSDVSFPAP